MTGEANEGKALTATLDGTEYARIPIRTRVVMPGDDLDTFIREYADGKLEGGDILFVTEKIVAITQGRSYLVEEIKPRKLAYFLSKYVTRTPHGIGLGMPETMEMALRECGTLRILFASAVAAVTMASAVMVATGGLTTVIAAVALLAGSALFVTTRWYTPPVAGAV